jgi:DNA-binding LacI/PurR family transcriptional regulator
MVLPSFVFCIRLGDNGGSREQGRANYADPFRIRSTRCVESAAGRAVAPRRPFAGIAGTGTPVQCVAVGHRTRLGHRRIGFLGHAPRTTDHAERLQAFQQGVSKFHLDTTRCLVDATLAMQPTPNDIARCMDHLLALTPRPTALITGGCSITPEVIQYLDTCPLSVPDELSLIAFDDVSAPPASGIPPLTVIQQPLAHLGERAAGVLHLLEHPTPKLIREVLHPHLILRQSCAPCRPA